VATSETARFLALTECLKSCKDRNYVKRDIEKNRVKHGIE